MDNITLSRSQLYELIWSKPTITLAKELGLSDNGLRKICKKYNIPLPYLGYWSKVKHGKPVRKVKLFDNFNGVDEIVINSNTETRDLITKEFSKRSALKKEIETKHKHIVEVPLRLTNPDLLVVKAKEALTINKDYFSRNGLIRTRMGFISIHVAPENVNRALRFMDSFIKLLRARGHEINVGRETHVVVLGESLVFRLQEKLRVEDVADGKFSWKTRHYYPTGVFMVRCWKTFQWHQRVWMDGKISIEKQLAKIVAGIESLAIKERDERLANEKRWKVEEEERRIEKEKRDWEELDGANFQRLLVQSKQWKQAQILSEFIAEIENKLTESGNLTVESKEWLIWAKKKSDEFNPLNNLI